MTNKFCIDCVNSAIDKYSLPPKYHCYRLVNESVDLVLGDRQLSNILNCYEERKSSEHQPPGTINFCGPEGKYWVKRDES